MFYPHAHPCYELYFLMSGDRYYYIGEKVLRVKSGDMVLIPKEEQHCTKNYKESPYERVVLSVFEDFLAPLSHTLPFNPFSLFEKGGHIIRLAPKEQLRVLRLLEAMLSDFASPSAESTCLLQAALLELLCLLYRAGDAASHYGDDTHSESRKTVMDITAYITSHYAESLTLHALAEKHYISPYYLSRIFKKTTGVSFPEYVNSVRIRAAKELLSEPALSVADVAMRTGFSSLTHFGRCFKALVGISPREYRAASAKKK